MTLLNYLLSWTRKLSKMPHNSFSNIFLQKLHETQKNKECVDTHNDLTHYATLNYKKTLTILRAIQIMPWNINKFLFFLDSPSNRTKKARPNHLSSKQSHMTIKIRGESITKRPREKPILLINWNNMLPNFLCCQAIPKYMKNILYLWPQRGQELLCPIHYWVCSALVSNFCLDANQNKILTLCCPWYFQLFF